MDSRQLSLFDAPPRPLPAVEEPPSFGGATYDPLYDADLLTKQLGRVYHVMHDGRWRTLAEIREDIRLFCGWVNGAPPHDTEAAISARLRDLRQKKYGSHLVEKRRRGEPRRGLWEYRLVY